MTDLARSDVYPPEVEVLGDMTTCSDHAPGCPCQSGGDPLLRPHAEHDEIVESCYDCQEKVAGTWHDVMATY